MITVDERNNFKQGIGAFVYNRKLFSVKELFPPRQLSPQHLDRKSVPMTTAQPVY